MLTLFFVVSFLFVCFAVYAAGGVIYYKLYKHDKRSIGELLDVL